MPRRSGNHFTRVDTGGTKLTNGDGIRLEGSTLLVVQHLENQIAELQLDADLTRASLRRLLRDPALNTPTTVASFDGTLFVVNPRFRDVPVGSVRPGDVFTVSRRSVTLTACATRTL